MKNDTPAPGDPTVPIALFEGALAIVAVVVGRWIGVRPLATFQASWAGLGLGLLAALPMLAILALCVWGPFRALNDLVRLVRGQISSLFGRMTLTQMALLSLMAGVGEETLFRGLLQSAVGGWVGGTPGAWAGLAVATVVFAAGHAISRAYFVLAGVIGLYLGLVWMASGNLLVPILAHALYDFAAMVHLRKEE